MAVSATPGDDLCAHWQASQLVCFNGSNRSQGATRRLNLCEGADDTEQLIPIVAALGRLVTVAAPVTLVLDNLPAHTSLAMRAWLTDQHAWLTVA